MAVISCQTYMSSWWVVNDIFGGSPSSTSTWKNATQTQRRKIDEIQLDQ